MKKKGSFLLLLISLTFSALAVPTYASQDSYEGDQDHIQNTLEAFTDSTEAMSGDTVEEYPSTDDILKTESAPEDEEMYEETDTEALTNEDELCMDTELETCIETGDTTEEQPEDTIPIEQVEELPAGNGIASASSEIIASGIFGVNLVPDEYGDITGHDGDNLRWIFYADGVLTIKGKGGMGDFWSTEESKIRPWEDYIPDIRKVIIEDGVTTIGKGAFHNHTALTSVTIPNSVYGIICFAFRGCTSLTSIDIPDSVGYLGNRVFEGCTNLKDVTIPESVHGFGADDFYGTPWQAAQGDFCIVNHNLLAYQGTESDVEIPVWVRTIVAQAFSHNEYVENVTIPDWVEYINLAAFGGKKALKNINISEKNQRYASVEGIVFDKEKTSLLLFPDGREGEYAIPEGVLSIGESAFANGKLSSVTIPGSVKDAGTYAFGFSALEHITIPWNLQTIRWGMFSGCSNLNRVEIDHGVRKLDDYAFANCTSLRTVVLPSSVNEVGLYSFQGCNNLTSIFFENDNCNIYDHKVTLVSPDKVTLYGTRGSTAEEYAKQYGYTFGLASTEKPVLKSVDTVPEGAKLSWNAVDGAVCYRILYRSGSGSWEKLTDTINTEFIWADGKDGTKYDFTVQCVTRDGITALSGYDEVGKTLVYVAPPKKPETEKFDTESTGADASDSWYEQDDWDDWGNWGNWDNPDDGSIASCRITLSKTKYVYNGKKRKPSVTVKDGGKKLILNTHYKVSYKNNLNAGTAFVIITGKGNYSGKVTKTFRIKKKAQKLKASISARSVKAGKVLKIKIKKSIGKVTYKSLDPKIAKIISKGKIRGISAGKVKIVVKAAGDKNHKAASKTFKIKVK